MSGGGGDSVASIREFLLLSLAMRTQKLTETLSQVVNVREAIAALRAGKEFPAANRAILLAAYLETCIEHHRAIETLIRAELIGSAYALARPLAECLIRASWVSQCASDAQVERVCRDADAFPGAKRMAEDIDAAYATKGFFLEFKKNQWAIMCDYAHTGTLQVQRRFTGNHAIPNYRDEEIIEVLNVTTSALITLSLNFFVAIGCEREADVVLNMAMAWVNGGTPHAFAATN